MRHMTRAPELNTLEEAFVRLLITVPSNQKHDAMNHARNRQIIRNVGIQMKRRNPLTVLTLTVLLLAVQVQAQDLSFSDPAKVAPPPVWAVGQAVRTADLDVSPGFQKPPAGFGVVPFFWWLGDPLTKERLSWELDQMKGMGVAGYQINYAHMAAVGAQRRPGRSMPSSPIS